jgi:hypothetical protein
VEADAPVAGWGIKPLLRPAVNGFCHGDVLIGPANCHAFVRLSGSHAKSPRKRAKLGAGTEPLTGPAMIG